VRSAVEVCGVVRYCGRNADHRGQHGGFRRLGTTQSGPRQLHARGTLLTPQEYRVVRLTALGDTWTTVCIEAGISRTTLSKHLTAAKDKYRVVSMPELYAALGWLEVPEA
jgi:DNA-binding CsgD family transcriptional regulator